MSNAKVFWVATISDGTSAVEHQGEFQIISGERKPWVRLIKKLEAEGKYLTSLRLQAGERVINMPRLKNNRFDSYPPLYYSLSYIYEADDLLGRMTEKHFINLGAHYKDYAVHFIQDMNDISSAWITVTDNQAPAPSPEHESKNNHGPEGGSSH